MVMEEKRILVMGHVAPDGDSVSSALAIARKENGVLYVHEPHLNPTLSWLVEETGIKVLHDKEAVAWKPEKLIVVDCAPTKLRAGFPIETYLAVNPDVTVRNIDHHADRVGEEPLLFESRVEKIIDPKASSTAARTRLDQQSARVLCVKARRRLDPETCTGFPVFLIRGPRPASKEIAGISKNLRGFFAPVPAQFERRDKQ
jgi:hypothetical protein